ncbi:hypothetical protein HPB47_007129, partial [Ixodes persulcatus]
DAQKKGLTTGLKNPSGKDEQHIIVLVESKEGFVVGAAEVFPFKKGSGDYRQEISGQRFEEGITKKLPPNLQPMSAVVTDNASYHSVKLHSLPTTSTNKLGIHLWLSNNGIASDLSMLKVELLNLFNKPKAARPELEKYCIDAIAEHHSHSVFRFPLYHCDLNPVELVLRVLSVCPPVVAVETVILVAPVVLDVFIHYALNGRRSARCDGHENKVSQGNADVLVDAWCSMTRHVVHIHAGHPGIYTICVHNPIEEGEWLVPGEWAFHISLTVLQSVNGKTDGL